MKLSDKFQLEAERDRLIFETNFFNVNTPEREKKVKRIEEIERLLKGA